MRYPPILITLLSFGIPFTSSAQEAEPKSAIDRVASGDLYFDQAEEAIFEELADSSSTEVITKLLNGAAKAKSPADAMYLVSFIVWVRDELFIMAEDEGLEVPPFEIDLPTTSPLWAKALADERTDGYTVAGKPNTVALQAAIALETILTDVEEEDVLWDLWATAGGHVDHFYLQRAKDRVAGKKVPSLTEVLESREPDEDSFDALAKEFRDTPEEERPDWLNKRTIWDILVLQFLASENPAIGGQLLKIANRVTGSILDKRGIAAKSPWQPKSKTFDKALLEETIARAVELTKEGKRCTLTITRQGGMCGVEIIEFPLVDGSDSLKWELYDGSPVAKVVDYAELFGLFCNGAIVASYWSDGESSDVYEEAQWLVDPKPEPPSAERWESIKKEAEESQNDLIDTVMKSISEPTSASQQFTLMFWCLPLDKLD